MKRMKRVELFSAGKKRYMVTGHITISLGTEVEASSPEDAKEIALSRGYQSFCHQCASGDHKKVWSMSGELDGELDEDTIEAEEL